MAKKSKRKLSEIEVGQEIDQIQFRTNPFKLTEKQKEVFLFSQEDSARCVILDGVPGSGKTWISLYMAIAQIQQGKKSGITYLRGTSQSTDGEVGFLAGDMSSKMQYMNVPLAQKIEEIVHPLDRDLFHSKVSIETYPTGILRSYNFEDEIIILSEAQNNYFETIFTVATRAGKNCLVIIEGDSELQNDIGKRSGFKKFIDLYSDEESLQHGIKYMHFNESDIMRSGFVQYIVSKYRRSLIKQ